jgi:hypothetical protein
MRRVCEVALLGLGLACTDGGPNPASFELAELELELEAYAEFEHQPELERVIDPASQPRLELVYVEVDPDSGLCPYGVEARGFPAIAEDQPLVVEAYGFVPGNADSDQEQMDLRWLNTDGTLDEEIYWRGDDFTHGCKQSIQQVGDRVAELNARLANHTWRPLEALDAFYSQPGFVGWNMEFTGVEDQALASLTSDNRPIEVFYRNGHLIARVRGIKVLQVTPRPDWRDPKDEFCDPDAQIHRVLIDRATKLAVVRYNHHNGGCLCDDHEHLSIVELSDAWLAEIDRRSTAAFIAAQDALLDDEPDDDDRS